MNQTMDLLNEIYQALSKTHKVDIEFNPISQPEAIRAIHSILYPEVEEEKEEAPKKTSKKK